MALSDLTFYELINVNLSLNCYFLKSYGNCETFDYVSNPYDNQRESI